VIEVRFAAAGEKYVQELTGTPDTRFDEEGDWIAQQFFSPADRQLSPEEYAARHAQLLGCFSFHRYRIVTRR